MQGAWAAAHLCEDRERGSSVAPGAYATRGEGRCSRTAARGTTAALSGCAATHKVGAWQAPGVHTARVGPSLGVPGPQCGPDAPWGAVGCAEAPALCNRKAQGLRGAPPPSFLMRALRSVTMTVPGRARLERPRSAYPGAQGHRRSCGLPYLDAVSDDVRILCFVKLLLPCSSTPPGKGRTGRCRSPRSARDGRGRGATGAAESMPLEEVAWIVDRAPMPAE